MAEENTDQNGSTSSGKDKRKKTKFGMMMSSMGRSAKQGMSRAGKQMAKGVVKAKQTAVEKIAKVPISQEDPEIISALERLKITKNEIYAISDIVRNLYEARLNEATFLIQLSDKLKDTKITQNDPFGLYIQKMGIAMGSLEQIQSEHLKRMEEELVLPLEKFRDIDIENVQKLKLKYKNAKTQYDVACHRLNKAQDSQDQSKIQQAQQKKDAVSTNLTQLRNDIKFQVNNLEQKKQVNLLGCMEQYWTSYASFASAQSNVLSKNTIQKESYIQPQQQQQQMQQQQQPMDDYKQNDNSPSIPQDNYDAMPPQQQQYNNNYNNNNNNNNIPNDGDGDYEYYDDDEYVEENENGPTDDYNPFGE